MPPQKKTRARAPRTYRAKDLCVFLAAEMCLLVAQTADSPRFAAVCEELEMSAKANWPDMKRSIWSVVPRSNAEQVWQDLTSDINADSTASAAASASEQTVERLLNTQGQKRKPSLRTPLSAASTASAVASPPGGGGGGGVERGRRRRTGEPGLGLLVRRWRLG